MPIDATTWADSLRTNHGSIRTAASAPWERRSATFSAEVSVMILHADPIIAAGLTTVLREDPTFQLVPKPGAGDVVCGPPTADVILSDYESALELLASSPLWAQNVVIFTSYDSEAMICQALESGARGYLLWGASLTELFEAIRSVREGGVALSPLAATRITNRIKSAVLSTREKSVLEQMMLGLSNKMIASRLNICVGTVKSHVKSILEKLDAGSRTAAVVTAQRRGLLR
jgi:DNA-binding NarL/FixJ family response regulator